VKQDDVSKRAERESSRRRALLTNQRLGTGSGNSKTSAVNLKLK
jgi:hypothetical protein